MVYDAAVIGGGPAGYSAALEAAERGMSVLLLEKNKLGGTCLNRGCVPTKYLLHTAEIFSGLKRYSEYGIDASAAINLEKSQEKNEAVISALGNDLRQSLTQDKIKLILSENAEIVSPKIIKTENETFDVKNIIIATGSEPKTPFVNGAITSDEFLKLRSIPKSAVIIGGGVTASEFAWILLMLGCDVTVKIRGERMLRKMDKEFAMGVQQLLKRNGAKIITGCGAEMFGSNDAELVVSAAGRVPVLPKLGEISLALGDDGGIVTDEFQRTSVEGIYAAGDVISGSPQLAHTAMEQGKRAVRHICGENIGKPSAVIQCIYLKPEFACVGLSDSQAKACGIETVSAKRVMSSNARTLIAGGERGYIRLTAEAAGGKLIGAQLMCERASDIVSETALAINNGLTVEDMCASVRPHPGFCEAVGETAELLRVKLRNDKNAV